MRSSWGMTTPQKERKQASTMAVNICLQEHIKKRCGDLTREKHKNMSQGAWRWLQIYQNHYP